MDKNTIIIDLLKENMYTKSRIEEWNSDSEGKHTCWGSLLFNIIPELLSDAN